MKNKSKLKVYTKFTLTSFHYTYNTERFENVLTKFEDISNLRNVNKEWSVEGYITSYQHDVICNSASFDAFFLKFSRHSSERVFI